MAPLFAHVPEEIPTVLPTGAVPSRHTQVLVLVCTDTALENGPLLHALLVASGAATRILPVITDERFRVPTQHFSKRHLAAAAAVTDDSHGLLEIIADVFKSIS